jgi:hypothetical protein
LLGGAEEYHEKPNQDNRSPDRDSKRNALKRESRALLLGNRCIFITITVVITVTAITIVVVINRTELAIHSKAIQRKNYKNETFIIK